MVPEDPAAVAARAESRKKMERGFAVFGGVAIAIFAGVAGWNFMRDTRQAIHEMNRPKNPWEREY